MCAKLLSLQSFQSILFCTLKDLSRISGYRRRILQLLIFQPKIWTFLTVRLLDREWNRYISIIILVAEEGNMKHARFNLLANISHDGTDHEEGSSYKIHVTHPVRL
jgi:hypothetical protein